MISLEKWYILTPLQKMPKNEGDLGKFFVSKGFKKLPKVKKNRPFWSHCLQVIFSIFLRFAIDATYVVSGVEFWGSKLWFNLHSLHQILDKSHSSSILSTKLSHGMKTGIIQAAKELC